MNLVSDSTRQVLSTEHAEAAGAIANLEQVLDETPLDGNLLAVCSDYFEHALRGEPWEPVETITGAQAAVLEVCEQFMVSVSGIRPEQIAALEQYFDADTVYNLMSAIYLIEMSKRLDVTLERVLS